MIDEIDFIVYLLSAIFVLNIFALFYLKGKFMSAGSNLKDAVVMLQNSHANLHNSVSNHVVAVSALTPDADVQAAADAINAVAVAMTATAATLVQK